MVKIFGPEHGFGGMPDAGEHVNNAEDKKTGIPVISFMAIIKNQLQKI